MGPGTSASTHLRPLTPSRALPALVKQTGMKKVCSLYQADEFGLEAMRAAEAALKGANIERLDNPSDKRGATGFLPQRVMMKARVDLSTDGFTKPRTP